MKLLKSPYFLLAGLIFCLSLQPTYAERDVPNHLPETANADTDITINPDKIIVKFKTADEISKRADKSGFKSVDLLLATLGITRNNTLDFSTKETPLLIDILKLNGEISAEQAIQTLLESGLVEYAKPDLLYSKEVDLPSNNSVKANIKSGTQGKMSTNANEINDPLFPEQWALNNTGQENGTVDADIDFLEAREITEGTGETIVAIASDGIFGSHEDLRDVLWINENEIPQNGIDDDNNGYIDDVCGPGCRRTTGTIQNVFQSNENRLVVRDAGTAAAGVIAANRNNAEGISLSLIHI